MTKFIVLSFAFMGLAFYVMSGGSDFVPESRTQMVQAAAASEPTVLTGATIDAAKVDEVSRAEVDLTRASLDLPKTVVQPAVTRPVAANPLVEPVAVSEPTEITDPAAAPAEPDLRVVTGSLVNMRDGPGTEFGVVTKVAGGTLAEVIEVDPTGWARIRLVDTEQTGWMAERLLAGG